MANNPLLYNAALAGSFGGLNTSRCITSKDPGDYAAARNSALAFASAVDTAIATESAISQQDANLLAILCEQILTDKGVVGDPLQLAQTIAAAFSMVRTSLMPQPAVVVPAAFGPVYVEKYLAANGNDFRASMIAALQANLTPGAVFVTPPGVWQWVGSYLTIAHGLRNNITLWMYGTEMFRDVGGVAGGQEIFFARVDVDAAHADRINFMGGKFSLLNCLTSYFGAGIYINSASNCKCIDTEFYCTLVGAATTGRIRWGLAFLGGDTAIGAGTYNVVERVRTTLSQIQICGAGRSAHNIVCRNIVSVSNNDYIVSCVASPGSTIRNITIDGILGHNVAGGGCVFVGSDGVGPTDIVENVTISNVSIEGMKDPDLDFNTDGIVTVTLGAISQNVVVTGINTTLVSTELQCRSVVVQSLPGETNSQGITISNCNLGITTTDSSALEALYVTGVNMSRVAVNNVHVRGQRGMFFGDTDNLMINNCTTLDGALVVRATGRNLSKVSICNSSFRSTQLFTPCVAFMSSAGRSMANVLLENVNIDANTPMQTSLGGGAMSMLWANVNNIQGNNPTLETLAGVIRAVNTPGFQVFTALSVAVPALAAGVVGYVNVSMAGTRMASIVTNEGVTVNPTADLVAAGAGGGFINARVSATGVVRCAFIGPLAGGAVNFNFARAAA